MNSLNKFLLLIPEVKQVHWMIVRGVENSAIMLGELELPPSARLKVSRVNASLHNGQLVTLASAPVGTDGALVGTKFDAVGSSDGYLEACMRVRPAPAARVAPAAPADALLRLQFFPTSAAAKTNATPVFLSSGAED